MRDPVEPILRICVFFAFTALVAVVTFQVASRIFFPELSQIWTEEATRFLFIYAVAFSAPLALKHGGYVNVDLINRLPLALLVPVQILMQILVIAVFITLFRYGLSFTSLGMMQRAPTIRVPIAVVYAAMPIMGGLMTMYGIFNFIRYLRFIFHGGDARTWS